MSGGVSDPRGLVLVAMALAAGGCGKESSSEAPPALSQAVSASAAAPRDAGGPAPEVVDAGAADAGPSIPAPDRPVVGLDGIANLPAPPSKDAPRLGITRWNTAVRSKARGDAKALGYLRAGAVVAAKGADVAGPGCSKGWRAIEPAGFVCTDHATSDLEHPIVRAADRRPDPAERLPYMYGTVTRGGPVYARIPTKKQLKKYEPNLKKHLRKWRKDDVSGASYGLDVWLRHTKQKDVPSALEALKEKTTDDPPWFLADGARVPNLSGLVKSSEAVKVDQVDRRQGRSFIHSFLHEGRRYNVTPDLVVIPADRFRPIRGSSFHGWQVDKELKFPFALIRRRGAKKWQWSSSKKRMVDAGRVEYRSAVQLTGKQRIYKKRLYYQAEGGFYVHDRHASRVDPAKRWPKWAQQGAKWIDINLTKQVLVAYEGQKMVYATLVSSGEAGLGDHETTTATRRGIFRIHTKYVSVTMDSQVVGEEFELRDVPYVQYFQDGYALHGAYWHDSFGRPKSHGCINLAPDDARRLFYWTDPPVPHGWHGALKALTGTIVFIHA